MAARTPVPAFFLALALLAAPAAGIAALDLETILRESPYTVTEKGQIRAVFMKADSEGIPRDLLLPRLAEGTAKKVPAGRLVGVLDASREHLETARRTLQSSRDGASLLADRGSWSLSGALLDSGASEQDVGALGDAAAGNTGVYRAGALLYAALAGWGASRQASLRVSAAVMSSAFPSAQYPGLVDIFERGRAMRIAPDRMADRIIDGLPEAKTIDDLRRSVLY